MSTGQHRLEHGTARYHFRFENCNFCKPEFGKKSAILYCVQYRVVPCCTVFVLILIDLDWRTRNKHGTPRHLFWRQSHSELQIFKQRFAKILIQDFFVKIHSKRGIICIMVIPRARGVCGARWFVENYSGKSVLSVLSCT